MPFFQILVKNFSKKRFNTLFKTSIATNNSTKLTDWLKRFFEFFVSHLLESRGRKIAEHRKILEYDSKVAKNEAFLETITPLDNFFLKKDNTNIDNNEAEDWEDKLEKNKSIFEAWIRSKESPYIKNKLIQILENNILIPKH